jgi:lysophospholipase
MLTVSVGMGAVMATMNQSTEAAESGTGGWLDAVTYMAGLSGGSWATGTFIANGGQLPSDMIDNVSLSQRIRGCC